uniref:Uncharacterized protein n=1 Tax=Spongospora subterranea TaxID=70186 RepID=A0A0H5R4A6_9EUKA|eukprot:CRZ09040.1 hypothetical protein [Spongospora subterranea]
MSDPVIFVGFTPESSRLMIGRSDSVAIYGLDPFEVIVEQNSCGASHLAQLNETSLVACVGTGSDPAFSPRVLRLINVTTNAIAAEISFRSTILFINFIPNLFVILLENILYVFDIQSLSAIFSQDISKNRTGLCAVTQKHCAQHLIAYPHNETSVLLFDVVNLKTVNVFKVHRCRISAMAFSSAGSELATASLRGTVIRIWDVKDGRLLHEFRRGISPVKIMSLSFSHDDAFLASTSDTNTVHIYAINASPEPTSTSAISSYYPKSLTAPSLSRSDYQLRLKANTPSLKRNRCIGQWHASTTKLFIVTSYCGDANLLVLTFDFWNGAFHLIAEDSLTPAESEFVDAVAITRDAEEPTQGTSVDWAEIDMATAETISSARITNSQNDRRQMN